MYVKNIRLNNFRNYDSLSADFENNIIVLYGNNAQGKTNLLEAMFLCAFGRSHRPAKDNELAEYGEQGYSVSAGIESVYGNPTIDITSQKGERKNIRINGIPVKKLGEMMGTLRIVMFAPEDLLMIKEGPGDRRKFLDMSISQIKPTYFYDLQKYWKVLEQRNNLLREIIEDPKLADTLCVWDSALTESGARIIAAREAFIKRLNRNALVRHSALTENEESLEMRYLPSIRTEHMEDTEEIKDLFNKLLERSRDRELKMGATLTGPQRDDFEVYINGKDIKTFGSQGQQRAAVLSIKMAEIDIIKEETNEAPVLLLDDVMSELDKKRQGYLIGGIDGIQTFITTTDKKIFKNLKDKPISYYNVTEGMLTRDKTRASKGTHKEAL